MEFVDPEATMQVEGRRTGKRYALHRILHTHPRPHHSHRLTCRGCGGPDDHYPDCLPASQGGTMPDVHRA